MALNPVYPNSEKIRAIRENLRLGQDEVAELSGLSLRVIQSTEGVKKVNFDTLKTLAQAYLKKGKVVNPDELVLLLHEPTGNQNESKCLATIPADSASVYGFIKNQRLFEKSKRIDLYLYTFETLATAGKQDLYDLPSDIEFRVLIRHPAESHLQKNKVDMSIASMTSIMVRNPKVSFSVRFYESDPLLRAFLFHPRETGSRVGLVGIYKWSPGFTPEYDFVGAEENLLLQVSDQSDIEESFLEVFQSRFDHSWKTLTKPRAVIFDLDGLLIDSMDFYVQAYQSALKHYGINIDRAFVYFREGEKMENTVEHAFKEARKPVPGERTIKKIVTDVKKRYASAFQLEFMPGAVEILELLRRKGIALALVTGSKLLSETFSRHPAFLKNFSVIVDGNCAAQGKPSPEPYELAIAKLRIEKENCCVIENAPLGVESAVAAGLACFAVLGKTPLPPQVFKEKGAVETYPSLNDLKYTLAYADTNIPMKDFYGYFKVRHLHATGPAASGKR